MKDGCLGYWLEDNVLDYDCDKSNLDFEVEVYDFGVDDDVFIGNLSDIPDDVLRMAFVNIEFAGVKDARTVIFNVDSEL